MIYDLVDEPTLCVSGVQLSVASDEEIRRGSVCKITNSALTPSRISDPDGLMSPKLGNMTRGQTCETCGGNPHTCPGHAGHIELPLPVLSIGYLECVLKVLRCVCMFCSRPKGDVPVRAPNDRHSEHFLRVYSLLRGRGSCAHCDAPAPTYAKCQGIIEHSWGPNVEFASDAEEAFARKPLNILDIESILDCISDEDCVSMGFDALSHPRNMVTRSIVVPSCFIRPAISVTEGSKARGHNDLTLKLQDILKRSHDLKKAIEREKWTEDQPLENAVHECWLRMQYEVFVYMDNGTRNRPRSGPSSQNRLTKVFRSLASRLKGKEGRMRWNLMGKRTNHCARTVISPDSYMCVDEVGVPRVLANQLTIPERVCDSNRHWLLECVRRGPAVDGGAPCVISPTGAVYQVKYGGSALADRIGNGWVVERHLVNGDYVLFNRQPSLHKSSIMAHRVRIMDGQTFRLNLSCAGPYNADFDGDEMNLHVPQNPLARAEARCMLGVKHQILSPQASKPIMGIVQDALLGAYLMSLPSTFLVEQEVLHLLSVVQGCGEIALKLPRPAVSHPERLWTGKQLLSAVTPRFTLKRRLNPAEGIASQEAICIEDGELLCGIFSKGVIGCSSGGVLHRIVLDVGCDEAVRFMSNIQRLVNHWLMTRGFSVGVGDCLPPAPCATQLREGIDALMTDEHAEDASVVTKGSRLHANFAQDTMACVRPASNAVVAMVSSGSKGNPINVGQIMGCVGQNCVAGVRIARDKSLLRTLPCYAPGENSPASRGFVASSYMQGLTPSEYFFHAMGGREGLVDTAVKTAVTGYMQRKMVKGMESLRMHEDLSVRNSKNAIVQFVYGGDGMDASYLQKIPSPELTYDDVVLWKHFGGDPTQSAVADAYARMRRFISDDSWRCGGAMRSRPRHLRCPFSCVPMLSHEMPLGIKPSVSSECVEKIQAMCCTFVERLVGAVGESVAAPTAMHVLWHVAGVEAGVRLQSAERILGRAYSCFVNRICAEGEMVGCIAAQSIGEPCTQMTLNTFHLAGVAERRMTVGVPRFKELVDISRHIKTPRVMVHVREGVSPHQAFYAIELRRLRDVAVRVEIGAYGGTSLDDAYRPSELFRVLLGPRLPEAGAVVHVELCCRAMTKATLLPCDVAKSLEKATQRPCTWGSRHELPWWVRVHCDEGEATALQGTAQSILLRHGFTKETCEIVQGDSGVAFEMSDMPMQSLLIQSEYLDTRTLCGNDVYAVESCLGLEAAISVLEREITNTITADGTYVEQRHISLMVDTMTHRGYFMPFTRHGMGRSDGGALVRSTFEETCEVLRDASSFAEIDETNGVSQSIIMGNRAGIGTGVSMVGKLHDSSEEEGISSRIRTRVRKRKHASLSLPLIAEDTEATRYACDMEAHEDTEDKGGSGFRPFSPPAWVASSSPPPSPALRRSKRRLVR